MRDFVKGPLENRVPRVFAIPLIYQAGVPTGENETTPGLCKRAAKRCDLLLSVTGEGGLRRLRGWSKWVRAYEGSPSVPQVAVGAVVCGRPPAPASEGRRVHLPPALRSVAFVVRNRHVGSIRTPANTPNRVPHRLCCHPVASGTTAGRTAWGCSLVPKVWGQVHVPSREGTGDWRTLPPPALKSPSFSPRLSLRCLLRTRAP